MSFIRCASNRILSIAGLALLALGQPSVAAAPESAIAARLNDSGRDAILIAAESRDHLIAFLPQADGSWRLTLYPQSGRDVTAFAATDVDGDGFTDLVVARRDGLLSTWPGDGNGNFALKFNSLTQLVGLIPDRLTITPGTRGLPDLTADDARGGRLLLKNDGYGGYKPVGAATRAHSPVLRPIPLSADFTGSNRLDPVEVLSDRLVIHSAGMKQPIELMSPYLIRAAVIGEFNGDGRPDLAVVSFGERPALVVFENRRSSAGGRSPLTFSIQQLQSITANCSVAAQGTLTFNPATCNINVGDTVTWSGLGFHTATSTAAATGCTTCTSGAGCPNPFNVASATPVTFNTAGTQNYKCNPHCTSAMRGNVNVTAPATPGTIPATGTPLTLSKSVTPDSLVLTWGASCSATATASEIYEGTLPGTGSMTGYNHAQKNCSVATTSATVVPAAGSTYYLIVARTASNEGSYGLDSAGAQIPPPATGACLVQNLVGSCG